MIVIITRPPGPPRPGPQRARRLASIGRSGPRITANLRTKILDFRGFYSNIILISRGGILMSAGISPEIMSQQIIVWRILVGRLGRLDRNKRLVPDKDCEHERGCRNVDQILAWPHPVGSRFGQPPVGPRGRLSSETMDWGIMMMIVIIMFMIMIMIMIIVICCLN